MLRLGQRCISSIGSWGMLVGVRLLFLLQPTSSLERFSEQLGVLEETTLEEIVLALGIIVQYP